MEQDNNKPLKDAETFCLIETDAQHVFIPSMSKSLTCSIMDISYTVHTEKLKR